MFVFLRALSVKLEGDLEPINDFGPDVPRTQLVHWHLSFFNTNETRSMVARYHGNRQRFSIRQSASLVVGNCLGHWILHRMVNNDALCGLLQHMRKVASLHSFKQREQAVNQHIHGRKSDILALC